jgi:oligopeptide/dipeptide ABC transporter ATP-binding protein
MENPLLEIKDLYINLYKHGKTIKAADGVSFYIKEGEILGLAGESGSGKTLTALSITGLLPQNAKIINGQIIYKEMDLVQLSEDELIRIRGSEISVIFQEYRNSLNPLIKVGRQITETLEIGGFKDRKKNKSMALELLNRLGFDEPEKIFNIYPHQLSGGMCQRVMTAIAAIRRPKLLLADEPSSALDTDSQERILSLLTEMNRNKNTGEVTTILIISHDLALINKFCNRFLVMYAGKIVEEGPAGGLFSPLHPYTQALTGAIPGRDKRGNKLENIPGKPPTAEDNLTGCPFAPRCKKYKPVCSEAFPPAVKIKNQIVYCYFPVHDVSDNEL